MFGLEKTTIICAIIFSSLFLITLVEKYVLEYSWTTSDYMFMFGFIFVGSLAYEGLQQKGREETEKSREHIEIKLVQ